MNIKVFDGKYTLEQLRQNFVMLNADEIELPRTWLLELIIMAQETEKVLSENSDLKYELRKAIMYTQGVPLEIMNRWLEKSKR